MKRGFSNITVAVGLLAANLFLAGNAAAEGALVVGTTGSVAKDGIAYGWAVNYKTRDEARDAALEKCRSFKGAPEAAAECRLIDTFSGQCFAVAMDPKAGTPGAGWAIESSRRQAERVALDECRSVAGRDRRKFCKVDIVKCDD